MLYTLFTLAVGGYGLWWAAEKNPQLKQKAEEILDFRGINALETRYSAVQIMETHQKKLLKEKGARFLDPELKFYPYLLLEVKYWSKNKTKEGIILWDLIDGEMVLDTKQWEKTHGFADCIIAHTQIHEFKILHAIAHKKESCDANYLMEKLHVEQPILEIWLRGCLKKNLLILTQNKYRLHLENPKLSSTAETTLHEQLNTKIYKRAQRAPKYFSRAQVEKIAKTAFGEHFSIRKTTQIYLPVHRITIQNPDGAIHSVHFNALSGKQLPTAHFYQ